jgi:hypothetical protein
MKRHLISFDQEFGSQCKMGLVRVLFLDIQA